MLTEPKTKKDFIQAFKKNECNKFNQDFMNLKNLGPITRRAIYRIYLAKAKEDKVNLFSRSLTKQKLLNI